VVEARGVVIATVLAALVVLGLLAYAASALMPSTIQEQACRTGQAPASECD
jgi:Tfp pilus assembly protein PilX